MSEGCKSSKGLKEWTGSMTASRQRRNGGAHLSAEEETAKGGYFPLTLALIAGGERGREQSQARTSTIAGQWLAGAI
jgi:hypothetical protein